MLEPDPPALTQPTLPPPQLAVIDTATGAQLCHTRIIAWSSSSVVEPGMADRTLREDFVARVHAALSEGASRLHVTLDL